MTREEIDEGEELLFQTSFHLNLYASGRESWESRVISCVRACLCRQQVSFTERLIVMSAIATSQRKTRTINMSYACVLCTLLRL